MDTLPDEINSFYKQLEEITKLDSWDLIKQVKPLSEIYSGDLRDNLITEQLCLRFALNEGKLKSTFQGVDKDGKEVGFPSFAEFSKESISYLVKRAETSQNPILVSRYNHILLGLVKNRQYAIKAIDAYRKIIDLKLNDDAYERIIPCVQAIL